MGDQDKTSIYVFDLGVVPGADLIFEKALKSFQEKSGWSESENIESSDLNRIRHFYNK